MLLCHLICSGLHLDYLGQLQMYYFWLWCLLEFQKYSKWQFFFLLVESLCLKELHCSKRSTKPKAKQKRFLCHITSQPSLERGTKYPIFATCYFFWFYGISGHKRPQIPYLPLEFWATKDSIFTSKAGGGVHSKLLVFISESFHWFRICNFHTNLTGTKKGAELNIFLKIVSYCTKNRHFPHSLDVLSSLSVCCFSIWGKAESGHFCTHHHRHCWKVEIGAKSGRVAAKTKHLWGHNKSTAGQSMACCSAAQNASNSMEGGRWPNGTKHFFLGDVSPLHCLPE